jgi:hypothetical protein
LVFLGAVPPPKAGAFGHGVTAAAHLFGHVASRERTTCPDDVDRSGQPVAIGYQPVRHVSDVLTSEVVKRLIGGTLPIAVLDRLWLWIHAGMAFLLSVSEE